MASDEAEDTSGLVTLSSGQIVKLATPEDATNNAAESSFAEWNFEGKLLYWGHLCWLMQELFWILLLSWPAIVFGVFATALVGTVVWRRRDGGISGKMYHESKAEVLVGLVHIGWVGFSLISCIADMIFDQRLGEHTPRYAWGWVRRCSKNPVECRDTNDALVLTVQIGFGITFGVWVLSCCYLLYLWVTPPVFRAQGHAFQTCLLEGGWMAFWVLSDFATTFDEDGFPFAIAAYSVHFIVLILALVISSSKTRISLWDGLSKEEMEAISKVVCSLDVIIASYGLWSLSSLTWILAEEKFYNDEGVRYAAAGTIGVSILLFLAGYKQAVQRGMILMYLAKCESNNVSNNMVPPVQVGQTS